MDSTLAWHPSPGAHSDRWQPARMSAQGISVRIRASSPSYRGRTQQPVDSRLKPPAQPDRDEVGLDLRLERRAERGIALDLSLDAEGLGEVVAHTHPVAPARAARGGIAQQGRRVLREGVA